MQVLLLEAGSGQCYEIDKNLRTCVIGRIRIIFITEGHLQDAHASATHASHVHVCV